MCLRLWLCGLLELDSDLLRLMDFSFFFGMSSSVRGSNSRTFSLGTPPLAMFLLLIDARAGLCPEVDCCMLLCCCAVVQVVENSCSLFLVGDRVTVEVLY